MRTILFSALALGVLTSAAMAEQPLTLSADQMDKITAGNGPSDVVGQGWEGTASQVNDVVTTVGLVGYNNADARGGLGKQGNIPGGRPGAGTLTAGN
jgi:hypothetical protein